MNALPLLPILLLLEPQDLLSLYLSDKSMHPYYNQILTHLNDQYHIQADEFLIWMRKYNESLFPQYMLKLWIIQVLLESLGNNKNARLGFVYKKDSSTY